MEQQVITNSYIDQNDQKIVLTIKYKVYIVVIIILTALSRTYMSDSAAEYDATRQNITALQNQKMQKENEYKQVVADLTLIKDITDQKPAVLTCLSTKGCNTLPGSLTDVIPQVRAFLQLQKNDGEKMAFDQKKILANINEYLIQGANNQANGAITSIVFGNLSPVEGLETLQQIPITLTIDFADKDGLLSFVYNVENTISSQFPMFYTLNSVNYDIVKYQENQTVTIELIGYMIK